MCVCVCVFVCVGGSDSWPWRAGGGELTCGSDTTQRRKHEDRIETVSLLQIKPENCLNITVDKQNTHSNVPVLFIHEINIQQ